ncbi:MAG: hypothetical protein AABY13_00340, partial [Nanoarchaeota archaeon]
ANLRDTGDDVAAVLDINGDLATLDNAPISSAINATLPAAYAMRMNVTCDDGTSFVIGSEAPSRTIVASGAGFFVSDDNAHCIERHRVWHR